MEIPHVNRTGDRRVGPEKPGSIDSKICFLVHTYHDAAELSSCLKQLRSVYPEADLVAISDGDDSHDVQDVFDAESVPGRSVLIRGKRLFSSRHGGAIVHRMLGRFLMESSADWLIKIDTDTTVNRRLTWLPSGEACFGTVQSAPRCGQTIQGGGMGFSRSLAQRLHRQQTFLDQALAETSVQGAIVNSDSWIRTETLQRRVEEQGLVSIDWMIAWAARKLTTIPFVEHNEFYCLYQRRPLEEAASQAAIVHPSVERCERMNYPMSVQS